MERGKLRQGLHSIFRMSRVEQVPMRGNNFKPNATMHCGNAAAAATDRASRAIRHTGIVTVEQVRR